MRARLSWSAGLVRHAAPQTLRCLASRDSKKIGTSHGCETLTSEDPSCQAASEAKWPGEQSFRADEQAAARAVEKGISTGGYCWQS